MTHHTLPEADAATALARHAGFRRLFAPGEMTLGLIMPLETYPNSGVPTMEAHLDTARHAEAIGISGLWMRDIPFFDPQYGDAGQVFEPLTYITALTAVTNSITLGTAGIVLPFREPNLLARQIASIDQLSGGRMIAGLSSGDRPKEYPLFDIDFDTRAERFLPGLRPLPPVHRDPCTGLRNKALRCVPRWFRRVAEAPNWTDTCHRYWARRARFEMDRRAYGGSHRPQPGRA